MQLFRIEYISTIKKSTASNAMSSDCVKITKSNWLSHFRYFNHFDFFARNKTVIIDYLSIIFFKNQRALFSA